MFVGSQSSVVAFLFVLSLCFGQPKPTQQQEQAENKPQQFPIYRYTSPQECGQDEYYDSTSFICRKCSARFPELLKYSAANGKELSYLGGDGVDCSCPKEYRLVCFVFVSSYLK